MTRLASRSAVALALPVAACGTYDDRPVQPTEQVVALFTDAIRACTAGIADEAAIDQKGLAAAGWKVTKRSTHLNAEDRSQPLDAYPKLRTNEYETTEWVRPGQPDTLNLSRGDWGHLGMTDECTIGARTKDEATAKAVVDAIGRKFGRKPDRQGVMPRGGDFLTPRFDKAKTGHYWGMKRNDVYLDTVDGSVGLVVRAMPDRDRFDEYSPARPDYRIPTEDPKS